MKDRRLLGWMIVAAGALLLRSGLAQPTPAESSGILGNPDRGLMVYDAYCAGCHGLEGRGDGPMAARLVRDFGVTPTNLADSRDLEGLKQTIIGGGASLHRSPFMPAWGLTLTRSQLDDLVAYVVGFRGQGHQRAPILPVAEELEKGRVLYSLQCLACHGPKGAGDGPLAERVRQEKPDFLKGVRLGDYDWLRSRSDADLEKYVRSGVVHSGLGGTEANWWHRELEPDEVRTLVLYLRLMAVLRPEKPVGPPESL